MVSAQLLVSGAQRRLLGQAEVEGRVGVAAAAFAEVVEQLQALDIAQPIDGPFERVVHDGKLS